MTSNASKPVERFWLDGPKLVAWLETTGRRLGGNGCALSHSQRRTIRGWRSGRDARLDSLERVLETLSLGLWEVPEHLWIATGQGGKNKGKRDQTA